MIGNVIDLRTDRIERTLAPVNLRRIVESVRNKPNATLVLWCLPALFAGGLLRLWLMQGWGDGFYYGPDSQGYWQAVFKLFHGQTFHISSKRPWLYPTVMLLTNFGPKSPAFTAALLQHAAGLLAVLPLAAIMRRTILSWRWWIVPATVLFACHPQLLYWEHVLIADSLFTALTLVAVWCFCRFWEKGDARSLGFALGAIFLTMATRPVGRALWLGTIPLMLLLPKQPWKQRLKHAGIAAVLYPIASLATHVSQGDPLMFASVFPLIELDRPAYHEVKMEMAPAVMKARGNYWLYVSNDQKETWTSLQIGNAGNIGENYAALANSRELGKALSTMIREAILHNPVRYAYMVFLKTYHLLAQNTRCHRLEPNIYKFGSVKFLTQSLKKVDPQFPGFLLRDTHAVNAESITTAVDDQLKDHAAQQRILQLLPKLVSATSLYKLPVGTESPPLPQNAWPLALFLIGITFGCLGEKGKRFFPVVMLGLCYLALTMVVGRAVERYRLPAEFLLLLGVVQGLAVICHLAGRCIAKMTTAKRASKKSAGEEF